MVVAAGAVAATVVTAGMAGPAAIAGAGSLAGCSLAPPAAAAAATAAAGAGTATVTLGVAGEVVTIAGSGTAAATFPAIAAVLSGPVGWAILGEENHATIITFDCWKQIVHDSDPTPSTGIYLKSLLGDQRIKRILQSENSTDSYPRFYVENIWNEEFNIELFELSGTLVGHATKLMSADKQGDPMPTAGF